MGEIPCDNLGSSSAKLKTRDWDKRSALLSVLQLKLHPAYASRTLRRRPDVTGEPAARGHTKGRFGAGDCGRRSNLKKKSVLLRWSDDCSVMDRRRQVDGAARQLKDAGD